MTYSEREKLLQYVKSVNGANVEQFFLMFMCFFEAYVYSAFKFGVMHEVTRDSLKMFLEFKKILLEEKGFHRYIIDQSLTIDGEECFKFLEELDNLNDRTVGYYYDAFGDIIDACSTNFPDRAKHINKGFDTLIESDIYRKTLEGLTMELRSIKKRLNFSDEFWRFINDRTYILGKDDIENCGIREENDSFFVYVPSIVNLETANMNVEIFMDAYRIFNERYVKQKNL